MRLALVAAVALAVAAVAPSAAPAADKGIHVDPGSPAGKEYALPLEQARREAKGGDGPSPGASQETGERSALFGEGIKKRRSAGGAGAGKAPGPGKKSSTSRTAARLSVPAGSAGGSLGLTDAGIGLAVLLAAGGMGLVLRRVLS